MYSTHGDMVIFRSDDARQQRSPARRQDRPPEPEREERGAPLAGPVEAAPSLAEQALIDRVARLEVRLERLEAELAQARVVPAPDGEAGGEGEAEPGPGLRNRGKRPREQARKKEQ